MNLYKSSLNPLRDADRSSLIFLTLITFGHLVVHWYTNLLSLTLPYIKMELSLTDVQVGTIITVQTGATTVAIVIVGYIADSFNRQGALIVSLAIVSFGLSMFVLGFSSNYVWTLVASGLIGLGTALWHPAAMRSVSLHFTEKRGMALSIHGVGASIGDAIGPIIIGSVIVGVSWKYVLNLHLIPALIIALILWKSLGIMKNDKGHKTDLSMYLLGLNTMLADSQALGVVIVNTLVQMGRLSILAFFPIYLEEILNYSASDLGIFLGLLYVTGIISQPIMGVLSDKIGRKNVLVPSFFLMGILYLLMGLVPAGWPLAIVVLGMGLFFYAILNLIQTAIMDVAPEGVQGSTMAVQGIFSLPFTLSSPVATGFLVTQFGIRTSFWYAAASSFLAALLLLPIKFRKTI